MDAHSDLVTQFDELYKKAHQSSEEGSAQLYADLRAIGEKLGYGYTRIVEPWKIVPHRDNRDKQQIVAAEFERILGDIERSGIIPEFWLDNTAFEEPGSRLNERKYIEKTLQDARLPKIEPGTAEIASTACSHFTQVCNSINHAMPSSIQRFTNDAGMLSKSKILECRPKFEPALRGLPWFVWKQSTEEKYPRLPDISQAGMNAKYMGQKGADCFQGYSRASNLLNDPAVKAKGKDAKDFVIKDVYRSGKRTAPEAKAIVEVASKYGGRDNKYANDVTEFLAMSSLIDRKVSVAVWETMGNLKLTEEYMCPLFMNSILMGLGSAPNFCTTPDIKTIVAKKESVKEAESIINKLIIMSKDLFVPARYANSILGEARIAIVRAVILKGTSSIESAASNAFDELMIRACAEEQIANPWLHASEPSAAALPVKVESQSQSSVDDRRAPIMQEYNDLGEAVGHERLLFFKRGFVAGGYVKHRSAAAGTHHNHNYFEYRLATISKKIKSASTKGPFYK